MMSGMMQQSPRAFEELTDGPLTIDSDPLVVSGDLGSATKKEIVNLFQIGSNNEATFVVNTHNKQAAEQQGSTTQDGSRRITVHVRKSARVVDSGDRGQATQVIIKVPDHEEIEILMIGEMKQPGCFSRISNFFRQKFLQLRRIRHGCIVLDLSPETPEALRTLLDSARSDELTSLVFEVLQKQKILDTIKGTELDVEIEIQIPKDVFQASGLTLEDLKDLPSSSITFDLDNNGRCQRTFSQANLDPVKTDTSNSAASLEQDDVPINFVIIGSICSGKSGLANIIANKMAFVSKLSASPVTTRCKTVNLMRFNRKLKVTDTPGGEGHGPDVLSTAAAVELKALMRNNNNVIFILTCRIGKWKEDEMTLKLFKVLFGPNLFKYLIIVFTGKDDLDYEGITQNEYLETTTSLQQFVAEVNRFLAVSKRGSKEEHNAFVSQLLKLADDILQRNEGQAYTWAMMEEAEKVEKDRQQLERNLEDERKVREMKAIEHIVMEECQRGMKGHLDALDECLVEVQSGIRHLVATKDDTLQTMDDEETMAPSRKKPKTEAV